jgi:hypothetical protein
MRHYTGFSCVWTIRETGRSFGKSRPSRRPLPGSAPRLSFRAQRRISLRLCGSLIRCVLRKGGSFSRAGWRHRSNWHSAGSAILSEAKNPSSLFCCAIRQPPIVIPSSEATRNLLSFTENAVCKEKSWKGSRPKSESRFPGGPYGIAPILSAQALSPYPQTSAPSHRNLRCASLSGSRFRHNLHLPVGGR